jgi:mediator of RNA polymerase II transcription subunit 16
LPVTFTHLQYLDSVVSDVFHRGIACSKQGTIASISPDGTYINLQCPRTNPSDGTWELSEPTACSIFSAPLLGGPIVHLAWAPTNSPELAIVDAFGRVCILTFPLALNKASFIARKWDSDAPDDLHSIVGSYWLPLYQARQVGILRYHCRPGY